MKSNVSCPKMMGALLGAIFFCGTTPAGARFFDAPYDLFFDSYRNSVYLEDVNGDGLDDSIVGEGNGGGFTVYLSNPDGSIQPGINSTAGFSGIEGMVFGDFDGDTFIDVFCSAANTNQTYFFSGNGDGTFDAPIGTLSSGIGSKVVALDVDEDTNMDFVQAPGTTSYLISYGNGDGTVDPYVTHTVPNAISGITTGFLNADSHGDLVFSHSSSNQVSVYFGDGSGNFTLSAQYATDSSPDDPELADLNGDTYPDILVACTTSVSVLLGNGDGTFQSAVSYPAGSGIFEIAVDDFNEDNILDVAATNFVAQQVSIIFGVGDGTFGSPSAVVLGGGDEYEFIDSGDHNGDGIADLIIGTDYQKSILATGLGDGTFRSIPQVTLLAASSAGAIIGDLNNDGRDDFLLPSASNDEVYVYLSAGLAGAYSAPVTYSVGDYPTGGVIRDVDGDGLADLYLLQRTPDAIALRLGTGGGALGSPTLYPTSGTPSQLLSGDVNGDLIDDLVMFSETSPRVTVHLADASGDLPTSSTMDFSGYGVPYALIDVSLGSQLADFNGDGIQDYLVNNTGELQLSLGSNSGTYPVPTQIPGYSNVRSAFTEDLNGDGYDDILAGINNNNIEILLSNGDGTFTDSGDILNSSTTSSMTMTDVNGDGDRDLVASSSEGRRVFLRTGPLTFSNNPIVYSSSSTAVATYPIDIDGDGNKDIMTLSAYSAGYAVMTSLLEPEAVSPSDLDFGPTEMTGTPSSMGIPFTNNGPGALVLSNVSLNNDGLGTFSVIDFPAIIPSNATMDITIGFDPADVTSYSGEVLIETNDVAQADYLVNLDGAGIDTTAPSSEVTGPSGIINSPSTILSIEWTGDDAGGTGINSVELFYTYNSGTMTSYGTFSSSPISFDTSIEGDGVYTFYTVATDGVPLTEAAPGTPDTTVTFSTVTTVDEWKKLDQ